MATAPATSKAKPAPLNSLGKAVASSKALKDMTLTYPMFVAAFLTALELHKDNISATEYLEAMR